MLEDSITLDFNFVPNEQKYVGGTDVKCIAYNPADQQPVRVTWVSSQGTKYYAFPSDN